MHFLNGLHRLQLKSQQLHRILDAFLQKQIKNPIRAPIEIRTGNVIHQKPFVLAEEQHALLAEVAIDEQHDPHL